MDLNAKMEVDHVIRVREGGIVDDAPGIHAPEVYVDTDSDGQILNEHERSMIDTVRASGWELLTGWTRQYGYNGPVMHSSEFVGGNLAEHILGTPGLYCVVSVETLDDSENAAGWAVAFREIAHYGESRSACGELRADESCVTEISQVTCADCIRVINKSV